MTRQEFSKAVAGVLKANFPELGTQREMEGADTVDALASLHAMAKRGSVVKGAPEPGEKGGVPVQFVFEDTGERRYPKACEQYFMVGNAEEVFNAEYFDGDWNGKPEGILRLVKGDVA